MEINNELVDRVNQHRLERLESLRAQVNWTIERERHELLDQLYPLIVNWSGQCADFLDVFHREEIHRLLSDSISYWRAQRRNDKVSRFIAFVVRTGFEDEPEVDEEGKPLLHRTTAVHLAARTIDTFTGPARDIVIDKLFAIYNKHNLNYVDNFGFTHFHAACVAGRHDVVEKFLELGQDHLDQAYGETGDSPLHLAVGALTGWCDKSTVRSLLNSGASPNATDARGSTPLHAISKCVGITGGGKHVVQTIFELCHDEHRPVRVDARDSRGSTPLHKAMCRRDRRTTEMLLRHGANPNLVQRVNQMTAMHMIELGSRKQHPLLEMIFGLSHDEFRPLQVNATDSAGETPLHTAIANENDIAVELLLRNGADPNLSNLKGFTPLHLVCLGNKDKARLVEMIFELSDKKYHPVQVDTKDNWDETPLHKALHRDYKEVAESLLRRGADLNLADRKGDKALHIICRRGHAKLLESLFEINARAARPVQVDVRNDSSRTPMQIAVSSLVPHVLDVLMKHVSLGSHFIMQLDHILEPELHEAGYHKLRLASGALAMVEQIWRRNYDLEPSNALMIMKFFDEHQLFEQSNANVWHDDERFARRARTIAINESLSLYDLVRLRPKEAAQRLATQDYYELACSNKLTKILKVHKQACALNLCEKLSRDFFRVWGLESFMRLTHCRLPRECCDMIIESLNNQDLYNICLATHPKEKVEKMTENGITRSPSSTTRLLSRKERSPSAAAAQRARREQLRSLESSTCIISRRVYAREAAAVLGSDTQATFA
ncbi:unnamed protein product [Trichogramma brassicae]|uniref:Uncharacterized protein n=1 Tax=Trichogramma brassicae TaxID=86971 RepID=A0A6H5IIW0_9HYME|nr:unnamed protein product [Trichogramma brassicae]